MLSSKLSCAEEKEKREEEEPAVEVEKGAKTEEERSEAAAGPLDVDAGSQEPLQDGEPSTEEYIIGKPWLTQCVPSPSLSLRSIHVLRFYLVFCPPLSFSSTK